MSINRNEHTYICMDGTKEKKELLKILHKENFPAPKRMVESNDDILQMGALDHHDEDETTITYPGGGVVIE